CFKNIKIKRKVFNINGYEHFEDKVFNVEVNPGAENGSRISFAGEGDQYRHGVSSNVDFVIRYIPHEVFTRDGADIIYTAAITLEESQNGCVLTIPTLDSCQKILN